MLLGQAQDGAQPFDLLLRDLPQHVRSLPVVHTQAQLLAQLVDGPRLQLPRALETRLLVVQAVAEAAEQRRRLGPVVGAHGGARRQRKFGRGQVGRQLLDPGVVALLHRQADPVAAGDQRADRVEERVDVLLLLDNDQELHQAAGS